MWDRMKHKVVKAGGYTNIIECCCFVHVREDSYRCGQVLLCGKGCLQWKILGAFKVVKLFDTYDCIMGNVPAAFPRGQASRVHLNSLDWFRENRQSFFVQASSLRRLASSMLRLFTDRKTEDTCVAQAQVKRPFVRCSRDLPSHVFTRYPNALWGQPPY